MCFLFHNSAYLRAKIINAISKMTKAMINTGKKIKKLIIRNKLAKTIPPISRGIKPITGGGETGESG
ncbi:hypothetical protein C1I38_08445 [Dehalobacter sp. 12DCB1]|nr:hypothetical protein C1I36_06680 [Dehalobacter sp. 14DCB1]TCX53072.1 hypothetical protein C1I38_08445 [Dehalobacter sp. 12DCB1]